MTHLATFLTTGLFFALTYGLMLAPSALDIIASAVAASGDTSTVLVSVDRSRKGDRLANVPTSDVRTDVARVEVAADGTVVLRDRNGATVFGIDPGARRTIVAKNVELPQLTIESAPLNNPIAQTPPAEKPSAPALRPAINPQKDGTTIVGGDRKPQTQRPSGCDPSFSTITDPELSNIFGRCVTGLEKATRVALAQ